MHPFRARVEAGDHAGLVATLAEDVVFYSPVAFKPFRGREQSGAVLGAVFEVLHGFEYTDEVAGDDGTALLFRARIDTPDGPEVQGLDFLRTNADGLVAELTVMMRPLSAVAAMGEAMGPRVAGLVKG